MKRQYFHKQKTRDMNSLYLNIQIPINGIKNDENHITKIIKHGINGQIAYRMSVLSDLLPLAITLAEMKVCDIINLTNPGTINSTEIIDLYKLSNILNI